MYVLFLVTFFSSLLYDKNIRYNGIRMVIGVGEASSHQEAISP